MRGNRSGWPAPTLTSAAPIASPCRASDLAFGREGQVRRASPLGGDGFEPSVPRRGQHFFETAPEPGDDKPAGNQNRILTIDTGRFTVRRARLAPAMISTPGHPASSAPYEISREDPIGRPK